MKHMTDQEIADMLRDSITRLMQDQMWSEFGPEEYEIEVDLAFDGIELFYPEEYFRMTGICPVCGGNNSHEDIEHGYTYGGAQLYRPCPVGQTIAYWDRYDEAYEHWKDVRSLARFPF